VPRGPYDSHPLATPVLVALVAASVILVTLFLLNAIAYAYRRIGISEGALFAFLAASLVGGMINIPVARLRSPARPWVAEIIVFGVRYRVPVVRRPGTTILAVNVGGALIPTGLSIWLLANDHVWLQAAVGVAVVAVAVRMIARPVEGLGIAVPGLVPPIVAACAALLIAPRSAAAVAYIAGTLGTLIGADLLNLHRIRSLGAGVASIGGAGTFDGVFLSGIVAVLLVGL